MKRLALAVVLAALLLGGAGTGTAAGNGCISFTPRPDGGGDCRYFATGAGEWHASPGINRFTISVSRDGGLTWTVIAGQRPIVDERPPGYPSGVPAIYPGGTGPLETQAGDLVGVTIHLVTVCPPNNSCNNVRVGFVRAQDV